MRSLLGIQPVSYSLVGGGFRPQAGRSLQSVWPKLDRFPRSVDADARSDELPIPDSAEPLTTK